MAHVKFVCQGTSPVALIVDGVDLIQSVMVEGFKIVPPDYTEARTAEVHLVIAADVLEVDLSDAVVKALREQPGDAA